jgi:hypothetical protein
MGIAATDVRILADFEYLALRDYIARLCCLPYFPQGRIRDVAVRR